MREIEWGQVTSTSPLMVRFAGDVVDTPIPHKATGLTLDLGTKVILTKVGTNWCVTHTYVDT